MQSSGGTGGRERSGPKQDGRWKPGCSGNLRGKPRGVRHAALVALDAIGAEAGQEVLGAVATRHGPARCWTMSSHRG